MQTAISVDTYRTDLPGTPKDYGFPPTPAASDGGAGNAAREKIDPKLVPSADAL